MEEGERGHCLGLRFDDLRQQYPELLYLCITQRIKSPANDLWIILFYLRNNLSALVSAFNKSLAPIVGILDALDKAS